MNTILVINCGSSSVKFQLIEMNDESVLAIGLVERIGQEKSLFKVTLGENKIKEEVDSLDHSKAISTIIDAITNEKTGVIKGKEDIKAVGHRIVHGAENFTGSILIDDEIIKQIEKCNELAPLHNPHNLKGILVCEELLSGTPQAAVFDTAFHQTIPDYAYMYALSYDMYEKHRFRRYGFHGTSHCYVANRAAEMLGKDIKDLKMITCHLGNGASITAVDKGKSVDTSMGFTPLEGLIMGTRCGDVDPSMPLFVMEKEGFTKEECDSYMNKQCGMLGITGLSSDMRDIEEKFAEGKDDRFRLAMEMYAYRIKKYIGTYFAAMNGLDVVVFTGGIGERSPLVRNMVCGGLDSLGIKFDQKNNKATFGEEGVLTDPDSKVTVLCVPTNEELVIARDTHEIVSKK